MRKTHFVRISQVSGRSRWSAPITRLRINRFEPALCSFTENQTNVPKHLDQPSPYCSGTRVLGPFLLVSAEPPVIDTLKWYTPDRDFKPVEPRPGSTKGSRRSSSAISPTRKRYRTSICWRPGSDGHPYWRAGAILSAPATAGGAFMRRTCFLTQRSNGCAATGCGSSSASLLRPARNRQAAPEWRLKHSPDREVARHEPRPDEAGKCPTAQHEPEHTLRRLPDRESRRDLRRTTRSTASRSTATIICRSTTRLMTWTFPERDGARVPGQGRPGR